MISPLLNSRTLVTFLLMFASSLPLPLISSGSTFQVWLTRDGVDIRVIGLLTLVGLPYNLKFLWAPLLDRFPPPFLGRRTGWIALTQIFLIVVIGCLGFFRPSQELTAIIIVTSLIAFLSASADIVIDAYRVDCLRPEERGMGAAMVQFGSRIAFLCSGALALYLADQTSWQNVYLIMAAMMLVGLVTSLFAPQPEKKVVPPVNLKKAIIEPFRTFFVKPKALEILLFVVLYKLADTLALSLLSTFLVGVGFTNTELATAYKIFGLIFVLLGSAAGGFLVARLGIYRSLLWFGILQALSNFAFVFIALAGKNYFGLVGAIAIENICGGMGTVAFLAFLMALCEQRFSATQYALLTSLMALARTVISSGTGFAVSFLGWPLFFIISAVLALPGLYLLIRMRAQVELLNTQQ